MHLYGCLLTVETGWLAYREVSAEIGTNRIGCRSGTGCNHVCRTDAPRYQPFRSFVCPVARLMFSMNRSRISCGDQEQQFDFDWACRRLT